MIAYQIGPFFFHKLRLAPNSPFIHYADTVETDEPFRIGRSVIIQYWPGRAIVIGRWNEAIGDEEEALMLAVQGREDEVLDEKGHLLERYRKEIVRKKVAEHAHDLDDEWTLVNALDLIDDRPEEEHK